MDKEEILGMKRMYCAFMSLTEYLMHVCETCGSPVAGKCPF